MTAVLTVLNRCLNTQVSDAFNSFIFVILCIYASKMVSQKQIWPHSVQVSVSRSVETVTFLA